MERHIFREQPTNWFSYIPDFSESIPEPFKFIGRTAAIAAVGETLLRANNAIVYFSPKYLAARLDGYRGTAQTIKEMANAIPLGFSLDYLTVLLPTITIASASSFLNYASTDNIKNVYLRNALSWTGGCLATYGLFHFTNHATDLSTLADIAVRVFVTQVALKYMAPTAKAMVKAGIGFLQHDVSYKDYRAHTA